MKLDYKQYPVLYVDDERANLLVFRHNFSDQFTVLTAESGEEALKILQRETVAILITDQRMPGMSGVELAERVQREHPDIVRMILTAYTDVNAAMEAINRGQVSRYITKPWRGEELAALLRGSIELFTLTATISELQLRMMRSERLALLGFVAAGIAHDLKSPLACLSSNLECFDRDLGALERMTATRPEAAPVVAEMRDIVGDCHEETRQINAFIDSIRVLVSGRAARTEPVDLARLVQTTAKLCKGEILRRSRLKLEHAPLGPFVQGDAAQLGQVLLNLMVNAAQAIEPGRTSEHEIKVVLSAAAGKAHITVSDTGKGIDPEILPRIFEAFYTTKGSAGGTGLGLAIVKEIVRQHGGDVTVQGGAVRGTTFVVELPAMIQASEHTRHP